MLFRQVQKFNFFVTRNFFSSRPVRNGRWGDVQFFGQVYCSTKQNYYFTNTHKLTSTHKNLFVNNITKCKEYFQVIKFEKGTKNETI